MHETVLTNSRTIPYNAYPHSGHANIGLSADFGNLPFSSAIKANGYPAHIQHQQLENLSTSAEYSMLPLHSFECEALGRAYLSFRDATLQMIADGMPARDVLGSPDFVNLDLYFRERLPSDGHSVSTFVCEMMKSLANPDMYAKLATMVLMGPLMRVRLTFFFVRPMLTSHSGYCFLHRNTTEGYQSSCDLCPARDSYHTVQLSTLRLSKFS